MCIQCSRCLTVFGCRNNPFHHRFDIYTCQTGKDAMACPANFNFVANCRRCYK